MGSVCSKSHLDKNDHYAGTILEFQDDGGTFFKEVKINDNCSVLVSKSKTGHYNAIGSTCSHYGANLANGVMKDGRIHCPWHSACFNLESGDIEEFPGIDGVPKYLCKINKSKVYVHVDVDDVQFLVTRPLGKCKNNRLTFVIIGSGAAGYMCAQTLRQEGFDGKILMITADKYLPYDRPTLTKAPGCEWEDIKLRGEGFFKDHDIEVLLDTIVHQLNTVDRKIILAGKTRLIGYDSLFIASGKKSRQYSPDRAPGTHLKNILTIYDLDQSQFMAKNFLGKRIVILGSSFIAMELASSFKDKCAQIDIISRSEAPFSLLGLKFGKRMLQHLLKSAPNVRFHANDEVKSFDGNGVGEVTSVTTMKATIQCDYVVVAIGVEPSVDFVRESPLMLLEKNNTITVNKFMETNLPRVYAGGDCCNFPLEVGVKGTANIGHWQVAQTHGRVAALNMLGKQISVTDFIPFFWSSVCGAQIRYCGYCEAYDEILLFGSMEDMEFCLVYRCNKKFCAACGVGVDPLFTAIAIELKSQANWTSEFPECLLKRFPDPPKVGLEPSEIAAIAARSRK